MTQAPENKQVIVKNQTVFMFDKPNTNNRIYPKDAAERIVDKINNGQMYGYVGFETVTPQFDLTKVSHLVKNARIEGDYVIADIVALDTPQGQVLKQLINEKPNCGVNFAVAGIGKYKEDTHIIEDFECWYISATIDPVSHMANE